MKITTLMKNYFDDNTPTRESLTEVHNNLPIKPKKKTWEKIENPEALRRLFELSDPKKLIYFLEDVIQMQEELGHHGKLLVEDNKVLVQISTHTLNRVTDLDIEWAAKVDEIYEDIRSAE
jgi:4a-hydroxytetrahydrobiopterin dehydratase